MTMASLTGSPAGYTTSSPFLLSYQSCTGYDLAQENTRSQWRVKALSGGKQGRTASQDVIPNEDDILTNHQDGARWKWVTEARFTINRSLESFKGSIQK